MTRAQGASTCISDIVGIGFGPSNLALAIALDESCSAQPPGGAAVEFFEKQPVFGWHRGMLLEGATMQVSFLKDLATMRNPASRYTFISYLHSMGRLSEFINSKTWYPLRLEFHDYLEWAARHFEPVVNYATEVLELRPVMADGAIEYLDVVVRPHPDGPPTVVRRARNVVLGLGLDPHLPTGVRESRRIWHSAPLLSRTAGWEPHEPRRFVVVGAGQSAAEAVEYLHGRFPEAEVCAVFSRYGYSVADDSPFANGVFDPQAVDEFHTAPDDVKMMLLGCHRNTNYSVVDLELSQALYRRVYRETIRGQRRLRMLNVSRVRAVDEGPDGVRVDVEYLPTGAVETLRADALIYATGYRPGDPEVLLKGAASEFKRDAAGRLTLDRDYRVVTSGSMRCGVYVHGLGAEHSHGLSAGLLSNIAVRAGEIIRSIFDDSRAAASTR